MSEKPVIIKKNVACFICGREFGHHTQGWIIGNDESGLEIYICDLDYRYAQKFYVKLPWEEKKGKL